MMPRAKVRECPTLWLILCRQLFEMSDMKLAVDLYQALYPSNTIAYALCRAHLSGGKPDARLYAASLIPPQMIMAAAERLVERRGGIRSKEIVQLEERLCALTTRDGKWR